MISTRIPSHDVKEMAAAYEAAADEFEKINTGHLKIIKRLINDQFLDICKTIDVQFVDYEPYNGHLSIQGMLRDFHQGKLIIHTTGNESKVWGAFTNLQFRAIHDYIHCLFNIEFNHLSEVTAYRKQFEWSILKYSETYTFLNWELFRDILRSEIVYQSAFKEATGEFHIHQKVILSDL